MPNQPLAWIAASCFLLSLSAPASAQLSITRPKPTSIQQVSATTPSLAAARNSLLPQVRVTVRYLMVDDSTRAEIYDTLDPEQIVTHSNLPELSEVQRHSPQSSETEPLALSESMIGHSRHRFRAPARVTTSVLAPSTVESIVELASDSPSSVVSDAPAVILIDGKEAEMNDVVQHPMVVDLQRRGDVVHPTVRVFEDGIRLRMLASLGSQPTVGAGILLSCEVSTSEILSVGSHKVYGVQDEPATVQVPIHQVTSATASTRIAYGHTLMIDPHYTKAGQVRQQRGVPMLSKLPYLNRTFKNVDVATVDQSMIILLQPSIEDATRVGP